MSIAVISRSTLGEGGLRPLASSLGQGRVGFMQTGALGVLFVGSSLMGELESRVEALPEVPSVGVISAGAGSEGVSSGGVTWSGLLSAE